MAYADTETLSAHEREIAQNRKWRKQNPDKARAYKKKYYDAHPEQRKKEARAHYLKNRDIILEQQRLYRNANWEEEVAKERARRAAKPEMYKARSKKYKEANPAAYRLYGTRKSAKALGVECDLDVEWFRSRMEAGFCEMSGLPFDNGKRTPNSPSVDRIDPKGPYTKANCRLILWWLNRAMLDLGEDYAISVFKAIIAKREGDLPEQMVEAQPKQAAGGGR